MPSRIKAAKWIADIRPKIKGLSGAICPVDLDSTCLIPQQTFGSCRWYYAYFEQQKQRMTHAGAFNESVMRFNYAQRYTETQTVEGCETRQFLSDLSQKNKILYVTARNKKLAAVTEAQLRKNKLPYNQHPEFKHRIIDLNEFIPGSYAKNTIIYTGGGDKGLALIMYLKIIGFNDFSNITAIDDKMEPLIEYNQAAAAINKDFLGFYYNAVDQTNHDDDLEIAEIQYREHLNSWGVNKIISDAEARQLLRVT